MSQEILLHNFHLGAVQFGLELTADRNGLIASRLHSQSFKHPQTSNHPILIQARDELTDYFAGTLSEFKVPLAPDGTPFQQDVWAAARSISHGEVRSYRWIAESIGRPKATRAVAQALGANPLILFVPCHRVVSANGELGGFSSGIEWKIQFLALEGLPGGTPGAMKLPVDTPRGEPVQARLFPDF